MTSLCNKPGPGWNWRSAKMDETVARSDAERRTGTGNGHRAIAPASTIRSTGARSHDLQVETLLADALVEI